MSVHFDIANGKFLYTWQVISDDGSKYFTSDGQLVTKSNLLPSAVSLAFLEYTTASVSSFRIRALGGVNYDVDWGDGSTETGITTTAKDHTYSSAGVYKIKITPAEGSTFRFEHYSSPNFSTNLTKVDGTGGSHFITNAVQWLRDSTSLTSFGALDMSTVTRFQDTWRGCTGLTSFGLVNTSSATNFNNTWNGCSSLTSFPAVNSSNVTDFNSSWLGCSSLTSFPLIDTSSGTYFGYTWRACSSLTSFPTIDVSSGNWFINAWMHCYGITTFPSLDYTSAVNFSAAWAFCTSLTTFPANQFDTTGTLTSNAFNVAWRDCALTAQSIENILTSLDTNGVQNDTTSLAFGTNANASSWSYDAIDAYVDLINKGWSITQNGTPYIVYKINNSGTSFILQSAAGTKNYDIDWGDGNSETSTFNNPSHTYASAGVYEIRISINSGAFRPRFGINSASDAQVVSVVVADYNGTTTLASSFLSATNLTTLKQIESASSSVTTLQSAFQSCSSLTSFPVIDTSSVTNFLNAWKACSSLTSFPSLDYSSATHVHYAWQHCSSLADFPANQFNSTGTLASIAFSNAWFNCALTAQSIENILTSLDTNGASSITLHINGGTNAAKTTWSTAANTAYNNLITKGWTITYNS